ncbi:MAG: protein-L-isoaspartate(D-aspartate) O-methyltransferase [candidate division Zixibacteria bacterium]|nr:protein-L-isoaspartate(D-aspartate) O-methyltransferase [candidate division Zixibacteria bacterium]
MKWKGQLQIFTFLFLTCIKTEEKGSSMENKSELDPEGMIEKREWMVKSQIESRGVKDTLVLKAMREVPRHLFVPKTFREEAYADEPLPIGENQTISQPYIVALMTELLELKGGEKILEIGTGSGYQAAILAEIAKEVYSIEIVCTLAERAESTLKESGYKNITIKCADGYQGWKEHSPFDGILVTAAPDHIPQPLIDQLKIGGRLVIPVGDLFQELILVTKTDKGIKKEDVIPVRFVPMTGEAEKK